MVAGLNEPGPSTMARQRCSSMFPPLSTTATGDAGARMRWWSRAATPTAPDPSMRASCSCESQAMAAAISCSVIVTM